MSGSFSNHPFLKWLELKYVWEFLKPPMTFMG
jgi:hypothetical protein